MTDPANDPPASRLERLSTSWSGVRDPHRFVLRYGTAIRRYLVAFLGNPHEAEEVEQEFLLKVVERGFERASPDRGRFRDYLKTAVRNAAISHIRKRRRDPKGDLEGLAASTPAAEETFEREWLAEWRRTLVERVWQVLDHHERTHPGNLFHTALTLSLDHPEEDSSGLALRAAERIGKPLKADAFRKQLSRARRFFAETLVHEAAQTLDDPSPERVQEELGILTLLDEVRGSAPPSGPGPRAERRCPGTGPS